MPFESGVESELVEAYRCKECSHAYRRPVQQCNRCGAFYAMARVAIDEQKLCNEESMPLVRRTGRLRPAQQTNQGGFPGSDMSTDGSGMYVSSSEEGGSESEDDEEEEEEEEEDEDEDASVVLLFNAKGKKIPRIPTGDEGFDRVLDGGTAVGAVIGVAAQPGGGKSTILRKVGAAMAHIHEINVLINCPEESMDMLVRARNRLRLQQFYPNAKTRLYFTSIRKLETLLRVLDEKEIDLLIQDSVDYGTSDEFQANLKIEMTKKLCDRAHSKEEFEGKKPVSMFLVYHSTKKDTIMGSNTVTHAVDAFVWMEHVDPLTWTAVDNQDIPTGYVGLRVHKKNRFGSPLNKAFYFHGKHGLELIDPKSHKPRPVQDLGRKQPRVLGSPIEKPHRARASRKAPTRARAASPKKARSRLKPR